MSLRLRCACVALLLSLIGASAAQAATDPLSWGDGYALGLAAEGSIVGCASTTQCTAVDIGRGAVTYNPLVAPASAPTRTVLGNSFDGVGDIACPLVTQCTIVDGGGGVMTFNPQSATPTGTRYVLSAGVAKPSAIGCPSATQCTMIVGASEVTFNPQASPITATPHEIDNTSIIDVSCPSTGVCVSLNAQGDVITFDPTSSTPSTTHYAVVANEAQGIDCPSVSQCTAVDNNGTEATFTPGAPPTITQSHNIGAGQGLFAVECPSTTQCTATNGSGAEVTFDPTSATPNSVATGVSNSPLSGLSCPSTSVCAVVDNARKGYTGRNPAGYVNPTLSLTAPANGTEGTAIPTSAVSAVLSGATAPTGTVSIKVYGPSASAPTSCVGFQEVGRLTVTANGTFHPTSAFTPSTGVGNYWWYATYSGDATNSSAHSPCGAGMPKTVVRPGLTLSVPGEVSPGTAIQASQLTATLSNGSSPTGTITFKVFGPQNTAPSTCTGGTTVGTATVNGNGNYHPQVGFTPTTAGRFWWYASYGGDASNPSVDTTCGTGMVEMDVVPLLSLSVPATGTVGTAISASSLSAVIANGVAPTGTITFRVYGGTANVAPTTCTGWQVVGTATVSGNGTYHSSGGFTPVTGAGYYWWTATYSGDNSNPPVSTTCGLGMSATNVAKVQPSVTISAPATGTQGGTISGASVSATLSGAVGSGGSLRFSVYGPAQSAPTSCEDWQQIGAVSVSGNGTFHPSGSFTPETGAGHYWWYASYAGNANNAPAASTCGPGMTMTDVTGASTAVTVSAPATGTAGAAIAPTDLTATLSGGSSPGGTVTLKVFGPQSAAPTDCSGGTVVANPTVDDDGAFHPSAGFTPSGAGTFWWYAAYSGDSANAGATSACDASMARTTVAPATPALALTAPSTGAAGTAISGVAALTGGTAPGGTITFTVFGPQASPPSDCSGGTPAGTATVTGAGNYPSARFVPAAAGDYWWYASYSGDANNAASSSPCGAAMAHTTAAGGSGVTGPTPGSGEPGVTATSGAATPTATVAAARVVGTTASVPVSCTSKSACAVRMKLTVIETLRGRKLVALSARRKAKLTRKTVTIGSASATVAAGGKKTIKVKLNLVGKKLLATHSPLRARLTVTLGGKTISTKKVTIKRPAKKKRKTAH